VQELGKLGENLSGSEGKIKSLDKVINEVVSKAGGGSEAVKSSLDRLERAKKIHSESRAECEKLGNELGQLMGRQAHEACKHAVLSAIAQNTKTDADSLNQAAEAARQKSKTAANTAAEAADKRWHTKRACGGSSVTTENTAEQAKARADKFRALAMQAMNDCTTAKQKAQKAAEELGPVKEKMVTLEKRIESVSKRFVEQEEDCSKKAEELRKMEKEIYDLEQQHSMSLSCIADFRTAMQVLPEKFSNNGQKQQYVLKFWEGALKESINTCRFFMAQLLAAKEEEVPAPLIERVLIPVLKKMRRDAQSNVVRTEAVQAAIKTVDERSAPASLTQGHPREEHDAKRPRYGQNMVQIPDDDEPLF